MVHNLPAVTQPGALARQAEQDRLHSDNPWQRADAQAEIWLRSPRFTDGTREQYARIYHSWRTWCLMTNVPPFDARRSDLEAYTTALQQIGNPAAAKPRPLSRRSIARHMAALSSFYQRAIEDEITERNPVPSKNRPRFSRESPQPYLAPEQLRALLAAADSDRPTGAAPQIVGRSAAFVALLLLACLRVSEALGANVEDLRQGPGGVRTVRVRRKGDKVEQVPLPPQAWARIAPVVNGRRTGPILATSSGARWDRKAAWQTIRRLGAAAGIETPIGPHTLRHAYITRGHELEIPVADLQDAAAHTNVDTTRGYDRSRLDPTRHPSFRIASDLAASPRSPD